MTRPSDPSADLFGSVVRNALDFLEQSVSDLRKRPKDSLIHFYTALELFFKARLMREHWTLVVMKPETAKLAELKQGDSVSVGMREAIDRLRNVAGETFTTDEEKCFDIVRKHRNKAVHFFHEQYASPDQKVIEEVVSAQLKAWFHLHNLLTGRWEAHFKTYAKPIEKMHKKIRGNRIFLKAKFNALAPTIKTEIAKGAIYVFCHSCGFQSSLREKVVEPLYEATCKVCDTRRHFLFVPCEVCGEALTIRDGQAECEDDEFQIDLDWLLKKYGPRHDPKADSKIAYCQECAQQSAIPFEATSAFGYLCLACVRLYESADNCEWCGALNAGLKDESFLNGCAICDGRFGSESFARE
jgi:hypothetical protein